MTSDGNELKLIDVTTDKDKKKMINYEYTKSLTKKGKKLSLTEREYENLIRKQIAEKVE